MGLYIYDENVGIFFIAVFILCMSSSIPILLAYSMPSSCMCMVSTNL